MQRTGEQLLADAGLADQQHGDLAGRRVLEQVVGGGKPRRRADHVGRQLFIAGDRPAQLPHLDLQLDELVGDRLGPEEARVLGGVVPFLDRLADDAAVVLPHADAFGFLVQDRPAHERRRVAAGVTDLRPAHRLGVDAVVVPVPLPFPRVLPQEFTVEPAARAVEIELDGSDAHDAFERVQLRPGHERFEVAAVLGAGAREFGVAQARRVAHPGEQAPRTIHSQRIDQFLSEQGLCLGMDQKHAVFVQPDLPGLGAEMHACPQVVGRCARDAVQFGHRLIPSGKSPLVVPCLSCRLDAGQGLQDTA